MILATTHAIRMLPHHFPSLEIRIIIGMQVVKVDHLWQVAWGTFSSLSRPLCAALQVISDVVCTPRVWDIMDMEARESWEMG